MRSAIYRGTIRHRRYGRPAHGFTYPVWHLLMDLEELEAVERVIGGFGLNRWAPAAFDDRDHMGPGAEPVRSKLESWLRRQGVEPPGGPVALYASPRVFGWVFNPISLFFCHDREHVLRWVVAEVSNTFGEAACYLLPGRGAGVVRHEAEKTFHVSPFQPVRGSYRFRVTPPGERLTVHIDVLREGERVFDATLACSRRPLTTGALAAQIARQPFDAARTVGRIHWQALRLWLKKAPFFTKPEMPPHAWRTRHD